jgi:hypothetical protein
MHWFQHFTSFLISSEKKFFGCIFNHFCTMPTISSSDEIFFLLELLSLGQTCGNHGGRYLDCVAGAPSIQPNSLVVLTILLAL